MRLPLEIKLCLWGETDGSDDFEGLSLPDVPTLSKQDLAAQARWDHLLIDPIFELHLYEQSANSTSSSRKRTDPFADSILDHDLSPGVRLWTQTIEPYVPAGISDAMLERFGLKQHWPLAFSQVVRTQLPERLLIRARSEDDLPSIVRAICWAIVAHATRLAVEDGTATLGRTTAARLVEVIVAHDWKAGSYSAFEIWDKLAGIATRSLLRPRRGALTRSFGAIIGDVLRYQSLGSHIRTQISKLLISDQTPTYLLGHSLGGVACFQLLNEAYFPNVLGLITVGSQAPFLYELDVLVKPRKGDPLPSHFPKKWLNIYDRNDILSFCASRIFPSCQDWEADSGMAPFAAHSAYFSDAAVWNRIGTFIHD